MAKAKVYLYARPQHVARSAIQNPSFIAVYIPSDPLILSYFLAVEDCRFGVLTFSHTHMISQTCA